MSWGTYFGVITVVGLLLLVVVGWGRSALLTIADNDVVGGKGHSFMRPAQRERFAALVNRVVVENERRSALKDTRLRQPSVMWTVYRSDESAICIFYFAEQGLLFVPPFVYELSHEQRAGFDVECVLMQRQVEYSAL